MSEANAPCECGCGEAAPIATVNRRAIGHVKGQPIRFINGHQYAAKLDRSRKHGVLQQDPRAGNLFLCECGCGQPTPVSRRTEPKRGHVKGKPRRFIPGHAHRLERTRCAAHECDKMITAEYCPKHASRLARHGNLTGKAPHGPAEERFWRYVEKSDGCWEWSGSRRDNNYGVHWTDEKRLVSAHRYSYELHNGPISDGLEICHRCDNPPCVRPDHLFAGTHADNMQDMVRKGRNAINRPDSCPAGHRYEGANLYVEPAGGRQCRACKRDTNQRAIAKRNRESAAVPCPTCSAAAGQLCGGLAGPLVAAHRERLRLARLTRLEGAA